MTWHKVADAMPDDDTTVLMAWSNGDVCMGYHQGKMWWHESGCPLRDGMVTHWADVPAHPEDTGA